MGLRAVWQGAMILLAGVVLAGSAMSAQPRNQEPQAAAATASQTAAYPESPEGLKDLLQDWLATIRAGDAAKSVQFREGFAIPNHERWFTGTFGPTEGARLEAKYVGLRPSYPDWLKKRAEEAVTQGKLSVEVRAIADIEKTPSRMIKAILAAEQRPTLLYYTSARGDASDNSANFLGYFVYADGGFRHFDQEVMQGLSTAPKRRIRIGGNVQSAKIVRQVKPVYPEEAAREKISGTVALHIIIAADGSVEEVQVVSGHPLLVQAAIDAVKQWRYQVTTLNGEPVEVDTAVEVLFAR